MASGRHSFHLSHIDPPTDQTLTLNRSLQAGRASELVFYSKFGFATENQIARAQVSLDGGRSWQEVWSQAGNQDQMEGSFTRHSFSLARFNGTEIRVRFVFAFANGTFFTAQPQVGFFLDDITVTDAVELLNPIETDLSSGTSFVFKPTEAGPYTLQVQAKIPERLLAYGPAKQVTAQIGPPPALTVRIARTQLLPGNQIQIDFDLSSGQAGALHLQSAASPAGPWTSDTAASIQPLQPVQSPTKYRVLTSTGGVTQQYYRIQANQ
jgi:hypothetical protein